MYSALGNCKAVNTHHDKGLRTCKAIRVQQPSHRLDVARFDKAWKQAGFKSLRKLAEAIGIDPSQMTRWRKHETTPAGDVVAKLCGALHVLPGYLFGDDEAKLQGELLDVVRQMFGRAEADLLMLVRRLTPHHKAIVSGRIEGWVDALEEMERRELLTPYDVERAQMHVSAKRDAGEPPALLPEAAPPVEREPPPEDPSSPTEPR